MSDIEMEDQAMTLMEYTDKAYFAIMGHPMTGIPKQDMAAKIALMSAAHRLDSELAEQAAEDNPEDFILFQN